MNGLQLIYRWLKNKFQEPLQEVDEQLAEEVVTQQVEEPVKTKVNKASDNGKKFIQSFEGIHLKPYNDGANVWTIGWGTTYYPDGTKVKAGDRPITREEADALFEHDIRKFENRVNRELQVEVNQNQFDALVSHTYNTGGSETLFRLVNKKASKEEIRDWFETRYITAGGRKMNGLVRRRRVEADLYFTE